MIRIEVVVGQGDIKAISDGLKKIQVGGITIMKVRGRGKNINPQIHAAKGTEMFTPEFSDKFILQIIVEEKNEDEVIRIIKDNAKIGKIFISPITRAIDIASGEENERAI
ncbi:MAG TPA: P-II family nitrogen regulator [Candidatus Nitrosotalea sp.]|nr:P-II family nitrogen regulator [Candidatus Nitrosotalea sp.]